MARSVIWKLQPFCKRFHLRISAVVAQLFDQGAGLGEVALGVVQAGSLQKDVGLEKGHGAAGGDPGGLVEVLPGGLEAPLHAA